MRSHLQLAHFQADEHGSVRISLGSETVAACQQGTESLARLDSIGGGMLHFALHRYGRAEIVPLWNLSNRQNVSISQRKVVVHLSRECRSQFDFDMFVRAAAGNEAGEIGTICECASFQPA